MPEPGGYPQDVLTRIYNVHWGTGGLAVEFGNKAEDAPDHHSPVPASVQLKKLK